MRNTIYFLLLCSIGLQLSCAHYFLRDTSNFELKKEELKFLKAKKFGLIGFNEFEFASNTNGIYEKEEPPFPCSYYDTLKEIDKSQAIYNCIVDFINAGKKNVNPELHKKLIREYRGRTRYSIAAYILPNSSTQNYFPVQNEIIKQTSSISDNSIPEENLRKFLLTYLSFFRHSGLPELESILNFEYTKTKDTCSCNLENKSEKLVKIQLKKLDIDYWVIANHKELYSGYGDRGNYQNETTIKVLSMFPALFTLWTFPYWDEAVFESKFFIYDKKLNLVKTFEYINKYDYIVAWWIRPDKFATSVYEPDVKELTKELYRMIQNQQ